MAATVSSAACRIIVLSSSVDLARILVTKIISQPSNSDDDTSIVVQNDSIPWTISNKYYTAPVHFQILTSLEHAEDDVPAVIYVWDKSEDYRAMVTASANKLESLEPEVSLAVGLTKPGSRPRLSTETAAEEFFSDQGFEYVDGDLDNSGHGLADLSADAEDENSNPGFNRIIDALNTVMWPSMTRNSKRVSIRHSKPLAASIDQADPENSIHFETSFGETSAALAQSFFQPPSKEDDEALQKWLDSDEAWSPRASIDQPATSDTGRTGFDDDFSDFVSAPTTNQMSEVVDQEVEEDLLPSEAEILSTSHQIFGPSLPSTSTSEGRAFDLSAILGTLQNLREEIGEMEDENERRKAAARVALGFIYGLDQETAEDDGDAAGT